MSIIERLKGTQEMKTLQTELKIVTINKRARHAHLEPLREQATHIIAEMEEEKTRMVQAHLDNTSLLQEQITTQMVELPTNKVA